MSEKAKILWVEDDEPTQKEMQESFGNVYDITFVKSSKAAKEQLRAPNFDMLVIDLYLENQQPGDGFELIEWAKEKWPFIRIVAVTGASHYKDLNKAKDLGASLAFNKLESNAEEWADGFERILKKVKLFFSYSKEDRAFLEAFKKHASPLKRNQRIESWDDGDLFPGEEWNDKIKKELESADIILLFISANALDTDYIMDVEIERAMKRYEAGTAKVVPIILSHCAWTSTSLPFNKLTALPKEGKPVTSFTDQDEAWLQVIKGIEGILPK
ncbi:MAG TPA: TIR domain-containing protein [Saprospiraceae bacterium]|nr:TIR domain-containing protein [Saprospiraceae bacterium]HMQ82828.1 TIR domain-containing protein [Saprospiraceae bacterium]